jgi:uncharacterized phage-associated protein
VAYSSKAIANYFLDKDDSGRDITQMKLHKLLYFAQGWNLAILDVELFKDEIQAWQYGPVVPSIWYEFQDFGARPITRKAKRYYVERGVQFTPKVGDLDGDTRQILDRVWGEYGALTAGQLSRMTHESGTPWAKTRERCQQGSFDSEIPIEAIKEYFTAQMQDA